jgi:hypothetical protein
MQENGGLGNIGPAQVFFRTLKHDVGKTETYDFVPLFKKSFGKCALIIVIPSHSRILRTLSGKNVGMLHKLNWRLKNKFATKDPFSKEYFSGIINGGQLK